MPDTLFNKFGDGIVWFQTIDYAKHNKKPVIFVTGDTKVDWWRRKHGKTLGPKPELIDEIYTKAGVSFYMYRVEVFIERAKEFLNVQVSEETIKEVKENYKEEEKQTLKRRQQSSSFPNYNGAYILAETANAGIARQAQEINQIVKNLGGVPALTEIARQAMQAKRAFESLGALYSPYQSFSANEEDSEENTNEDDEQDPGENGVGASPED